MGSNSYRIPLKVSKPKGGRIRCLIKQPSKDLNIITVDYLEAVEKDSPDFAKDGIIKIKYDRKDHGEIIQKITQYLEDLMLKELSNDENNSSSDAGSDDGEGSKKPSNSGTAKKGSRKNAGSIHDSGGGDVHSDGDTGGSEGTDPADVAEGGNVSDSGEDKTGD